jgi:chemotaxis protein CheD
VNARDLGWFSDASPQPTPVHTLHPGDVALAFQGERLETLLGSCIAVLLTDPRRTVAALCHIVHAGSPPQPDRGNTAYASAALQLMFGRLRSVGIEPVLCQTYVFGGGHMFPDMAQTMDVGGRNLQWVQDFLHRHAMPIQSACVGGHYYRKLAWTVGLTPPEQAVQAIPIANH